MPEPTPPKIISLSMMLTSGTIPPSGVNESCQPLTGAATGVGRDSGEQRRIGNPEANFFTLHVAARLVAVCALIHTAKQRVAASLCPISDG